MRVVEVQRLGGPEVLRVADRDDPEPLPTEVLVRVEAAGLNPVDWKTRSGRGMSAILGEPPFVVGWDVAGVVEAVGAGVTRFAPGDPVFGMPWFPRAASAYAELVTAPSRHFARRPDALSPVQAGALPLAGLTAWQALVDTAGVYAHQQVLIHAGAGGVGHLAVQIAKARGAHVIATASARNLEFLAELGVDEPLDYGAAPFEEVAQGVDLVIDLVGTEEYGLRSLQSLREGGLLVAIPSGGREAVIEAGRIQGKRVTGILVEPDHAGLEALAKLASDRKLRVEVEDIFSFDDAAAAHERLEAGHTRGKLVLVP